MLETIRQKVDSPWVKILLALVILSFAVAGIGSYVLSNVNRDVAEVNGEKITRQEFERQIQQIRQNMGPRFEQLYPTEQALSKFKQDVLEQMIFARLIRQFADSLGLTVSLERVFAEIRQMEVFQNEKGEYDPAVLKRVLLRAGYTPEGFVSARQSEMALQQLQHLLTSEIALQAEVEQFIALDKQKRSGHWILLDSALLAPSYDFSGQAGEAELKTYYEQHKEAFRVPEQVQVQYVELSGETLAKSIQVTEAELKAYYEAHQDSFGSPEERRASHILIAASQDAKQEEKAKKKQKAEEILSQLQSGADFAELAKKYSDDPGSAEKGGDLGYFGRGMMVPEFEQAVFALKKVGELSGVVETPFGYHIIKLTGIKPAKVKPFEEVRDDVLARLRKERVDLLFAEKKNEVAEKAYEIVDALDEVAQVVGTDVKTSPWFSRDKGEGIFANPKVREAAFSDVVLVDGYNSDVIEIGPNHAVVLRLAKHQDAYVKPFDQVREEIEARLRNEKALAEVESLGKKLITAVRQKDLESALGVLPSLFKAKWNAFSALTRHGSEVKPEIRELVFDTPKPKGDVPTVNGGRVQNGYAVVVVSHVEPGALPAINDNERKQVATRLVQEKMMQLDGMIQGWLKTHADIERYSLEEELN